MATLSPLPLLRAVLPLSLWLAATSGPSLPARAQGQVQLQCTGTLLEVRGSAELKRDTQRLAVSLGLEAEAADADGALAALQRRLAVVRQRLAALRVQDLRVTSPNTWKRPQDARNPRPQVVATLQVSGQLAPERLQDFIRQVGAVEGVRLNPVSTEADPAAIPAVRARLLRAAYLDALAQARELGAAMGRGALEPLDVRVEGHDLRPMEMRAMAAAPAPFDPAELPQPTDRLALQARFCAR
jgi:uncharacterized protein YggE